MCRREKKFRGNYQKKKLRDKNFKSHWPKDCLLDVLKGPLGFLRLCPKECLWVPRKRLEGPIPDPNLINLRALLGYDYSLEGTTDTILQRYIFAYRRKLLYASLVLEYVAVGTVLDRAEFVYGQSVAIAKEP